MPVNVTTVISGALTPQRIAQRIKVQKPLTLSIRDWLFPSDSHKQHPWSQIALKELTKVCRNVPVVRPGTKAVSLADGHSQMAIIEPYGVEVSDKITANEINQMRLMEETSIQQSIDNKTDHMLKTVRLTSEALAAQSITGTIDYPVKVEGGAVDTMEIHFGDTETFAPSLNWNDANITVEQVYEDLQGMQTKLESNGFGAKIEFKCGKDVFKWLLRFSKGAKDNAISVEVKGNTITIGGIAVTKEAGTYIGVNNVVTQKVPDNQIVAADVEAGHGYFWLALDDIKAGLVPLPFFPSHEIQLNPSQVEIVGRGKPLPAPIPKAICWATVG